MVRRLERRLQTGSTAFAGTSAALSVNKSFLNIAFILLCSVNQDRFLSSVSWLARWCSPKTSDRQLRSKKSQS